MKKSIWSLELMLVIGLPLTAVIASFILLTIAIKTSHGSIPTAQVDRFGMETKR